MIMSTHLGIAAAIQKYAEEKLSVKLDTVGFYYGNIKPDICPRLTKVLHVKEHSFDFAKQEIKRLMELKPDSPVRYTRQFSEEIGIILHYIADYFSYPHSKHFKGSLFSHYVHEVDLSAYCWINSKRIKAQSYLDQAVVFTDHKALCNYIEESYNDYMIKKSCHELELSFALRACASVCLSIANTRMQIREKLAA